MIGQGDKERILGALDDARAKGKRLHDPLPLLQREEAWQAILGVISAVKALHAPSGRTHTRRRQTGIPKGKKGRPPGILGSPTEDLVALLAPIYRRYAGAEATTSNPHTRNRARNIPVERALIPYDNGFAEDAPRRMRAQRKSYQAIGPFVRLVCSVAKACGLPPRPDAIRKKLAVLRGGGAANSDRAEAQARFRLGYRTANEIFGHLLTAH